MKHGCSRHEADRAKAAAAPSTRANPRKRGSTWSSTPSTPSARPARPMWPASARKAGCWCPTAMTMAASPAPRWSGPALKRLLRDVEAGLIDVVVVYKIDRLSRSLTDFSRLVEVFEANSVTFVSVTQSFNTTTSMGRLTLNILLSFAQFEREVIGERIRDKFAASRRKGMWMGGNVPFGYRVENRKLLIQENEAATVRMIFERFLQIGSATILARTLNAEGITSRRRQGRRQGPALQAAQQPGLYRRGRAQGHELSRRAPADHQPGPLGQGPLDHCREPAQAGRAEPQADAGIAQGSDLRAERLCHDAGPHAQEGPALPLLRHHQRAEARTGNLPGATPAGRRDRGCRHRPASSLLRSPEMIVKTWAAARERRQRASARPKCATRSIQFDALWDELFPAEQARIVQLLVERIDVDVDGISIRLRTEGIASVIAELRQRPNLRRAA